MSGIGPNGRDDARRRRFRAQAWAFGALAVVIYLGYLAFMVFSGAQA